MGYLADLHTHTRCSDGILSPEQLIKAAIEVGLSAISITDHDTLDGCIEIQPVLSSYKIDFITGIELSCYEDNKEYHILGYGVELNDAPLVKHIEDYKESRIKRAEMIHNKLQRLGINISFTDILEKAGKAPVTRPHIAEVIKDAGYVEKTKEAFHRFIGDHGPAYQSKTLYPVDKAIKMINKAGGVAVLAHPANTIEPAKLYKFIESGLDGIEVHHPMHNDTQRKFYHSIASQYWLLETGGSDFHGNREYDYNNFGKEGVAQSIVESIKYHRQHR